MKKKHLFYGQSQIFVYHDNQIQVEEKEKYESYGMNKNKLSTLIKKFKQNLENKKKATTVSEITNF